jgi:Protein of unknown function (DUF3810)
LKSIRSLSTQFLLLALGLGLAWLLPRIAWIRDSYSIRLYPILQSTLTSVSNRIPFALFDVTVGLAVVVLLLIWVWSVRNAKRRRSVRPIGRGLLGSALLLTIVYLWILFAWGLNYARPPLERSLTYDATRITPGALRSLAERAVSEANRTYDAAHAAGFPPIDAVPSRLADAVRDVSRELGHPAPSVFAHPKRSMFSPYFRASGVSGMLAPFFLETLLNPDLTGPERPYTLAHEWAHLSGFAPESDAGFVGILAALRADPPSQYSAWLALVSEAASQLHPATQTVVLKELAAGPRSDQAAINERLRALVPQVERAAWATYDKALKSQGVVEGVESYSRVVQLLLGTDALKIAS